MIPNKNTFCIAPFKHASINNTGKLKICCNSSETATVDYSESDSWFNSSTLNNLRKNLISGIKDKICQKCWDMEHKGHKSLRQDYNRHIGKILAKHWDKNFDKRNIKLWNVLNKIDFKNVDSFDLKLGNLCNLKCIMCGPKLSTQLYAEAKLNPSLEQFYTKMVPPQTWPESKKFKEWIKTNTVDSMHIKFTGGEPMMNPWLMDVLANIPDTQKSKCILHFTTNLTILNQSLLEMFSKFKEVWISISVEGIGATLEYARYGHKWIDLKSNIEILRNFGMNKKIFLEINHVIQASTILGVFDLAKYFDQYKIDICPIALTDPKCFTLQSIKTKYKLDLMQKCKLYNGHNKNFINFIEKHLEENLTYDTNLAKQCVYRLKTFDKVRKNSFETIIPIDYFI